MVVLTTITVTKNRAMKKILGCLIFIIGIWSYLSAQIKEYSQGSEFKECPMTRSVLNNLEVLCRVWGFVKYHHPVFSDSTASADYELFKLLPQIAVAEKWERNQILSDWIVSLGSFRQDRKGYVRMLDTMNYEMTADLEWLDDNELLGKKMSRTLRKLRFAERDSNYYLQRRIVRWHGIQIVVIVCWLFSDTGTLLNIFIHTNG